MKGVDAVAAIGASGMADMDKLSNWIAQSRLDPNDPSNADLMYLLRVSAPVCVFGTSSIGKVYAHLHPQLPYTHSCTYRNVEQISPWALKDKHSVRPKLIRDEISFILPGYIGKMV